MANCIRYPTRALELSIWGEICWFVFYLYLITYGVNPCIALAAAAWAPVAAANGVGILLGSRNAAAAAAAAAAAFATGGNTALAVRFLGKATPRSAATTVFYSYFRLLQVVIVFVLYDLISAIWYVFRLI